MRVSLLQAHLPPLLLLLLAALSVLVRGELDEEQLPTAQLLSRADGLLSSGKGADALQLYSVAVDRDPASYVSS